VIILIRGVIFIENDFLIDFSKFVIILIWWYSPN